MDAGRSHVCSRSNLPYTKGDFYIHIHPCGGNLFMLHFTPRGQGLVEYAMIILLVGVVVIVLVWLFGAGVGNMFSNVVHNI